MIPPVLLPELFGDNMFVQLGGVETSKTIKSWLCIFLRINKSQAPKVVDQVTRHQLPGTQLSAWWDLDDER